MKKWIYVFTVLLSICLLECKYISAKENIYDYSTIEEVFNDGSYIETTILYDASPRSKITSGQKNCTKPLRGSTVLSIYFFVFFIFFFHWWPFVLKLILSF